MLGYLIAATGVASEEGVPVDFNHSHKEITPEPLAHHEFLNGRYSCLADRQFKLDWLHVHDSSIVARGFMDESSRVMSAVSRVVDKLFNKDGQGNYDGSRVTFSLMDVIDKEIVCSTSGTTDCSCDGSAESFAFLNFEDLACSKFEYSGGSTESTAWKVSDSETHAECGVWKGAFENMTYRNYISRTSIFDPVLNYSDSFFDEAVVDEEGILTLRVITALTPNCGRISPRDTLSDNPDLNRGLPDQLWYNVLPDQREEWVVNPGIDEYTGELLDGSCESRDYPTVAELAKNMQRSSTGLSVIGYDHIYNDCDDTLGEFAIEFNDFYGSTVGFEMKDKGVPFRYTVSDMTESDLAVKLIDAILYSADPCRDHPSLPTKPDVPATTEAPITTTDKVEPTATTKEATTTLDGTPTDVVSTEVPVRTPDGTTEGRTTTLDGTPTDVVTTEVPVRTPDETTEERTTSLSVTTDVVTTEVPVRTPDETTEERTTSLSVTTAEANTTVAVIPRCTHYDVLVEKKRFHGESLPEGFHVANSVEAIKYLAEFMSKRIDGYHVELIDGFIRKNIVDYVFPTHDDTYGNSGYTYEGLISDVCSPVVPAINIVDCYSDCARLIGKEEQIPQGFHQASSAEANAFREEMGSYMGTVEIAELTDAQFMGSSYNLEIKMEINPWYNRIGIVRDYIPRCD